MESSEEGEGKLKPKVRDNKKINEKKKRRKESGKDDEEEEGKKKDKG